MKLLLVGTIATAVFAGVPKFSGTTFANFFDSAVSRQLSESSGESSGEQSVDPGNDTVDPGNGNDEPSFDEVAFGVCWHATLFQANTNDDVGMAMNMTEREAACDELDSECKGLYRMCTKDKDEFCLTDAASFNTALAMRQLSSSAGSFNPEMCSHCTQSAFHTLRKGAGRVQNFLAANSSYEADPQATLIHEMAKISGEMMLKTSKASCQKDNNQTFCGAKFAQMMTGGQDGESDGPPACIATCYGECAQTFTANSTMEDRCSCVNACDKAQCGSDELATIESFCSAEAIAAAAHRFQSVAQLCIDCGNLEGECSDKCKGTFRNLQKQHGACSMGFLEMMLNTEEMTHGFSGSKDPFTTCFKSAGLVNAFIDAKCSIKGVKPIVPPAKTVLKVETSMSVANPLSAVEQSQVRDSYCDLVQVAAAEASGSLPEQILMRCQISEVTVRRRLLATSYALVARVMAPVAAADAEDTGFVPLETLVLTEDSLTEVSSTLAADVEQELAITPTVAAITSAVPTAEELVAEAKSEQVRVATEKTQVGIAISADELAALPDDVRTAVEAAVADPANAPDATTTTTAATTAPTTAEAAAPTTATFSAAPGRDAWSVAAALVVAAAVATY